MCRLVFLSWLQFVQCLCILFLFYLTVFIACMICFYYNVCDCHAFIKGNLLTYLLIHECRYLFFYNVDCFDFYGHVTIYALCTCSLCSNKQKSLRSFAFCEYSTFKYVNENQSIHRSVSGAADSWRTRIFRIPAPSWRGRST